jgi:hypothetical protein
MKTTKVRAIKTSIALLKHFEKHAAALDESFNGRVVKLMKKDSKFKDNQ